MSDRGFRPIIAAVAFVALGVLPQLGHATQKWGPVQLSGNLQTQNLIRHPDETTFELVQNRNVMRLQLEYNWLQGGKFYNKYDIPFIESSSLIVKYRGVYDSIYDLTPGFIQKEDIHGLSFGATQGVRGQNVFEFARQLEDSDTAHLKYPRGFARKALTLAGLTHGEKEALKFDNQLREAYVDLKLRPIPLQVRAGRQQIVWGETDNFRMLDRANNPARPACAFSRTRRFVRCWDEIRRPFWMIKFLYDMGDIWKLSQNFVEWYWNPGDWYPAKQAFLPRPWGLPFLDPLKNPIDGVFIEGVCTGAPNDRCTRLMNDTVLFKQGDWSRNAFDNSQVGVRYHGIMPFGMEFTLNYFYQRFAGDDGTNYAPLRGLPPQEQQKRQELVAKGIFPAEYFAPYVHTIGLSANYSDEAYTQAVFRAETIYDVGIPFFDVGKETVIDKPPLPGITKKNMWKGMIGFDRPTWIRALNKKSTFFLTGQFFGAPW
ncbi:MAG: DUF1302 family protein [Candidatus Binatia bacterium]